MTAPQYPGQPPQQQYPPQQTFSHPAPQQYPPQPPQQYAPQPQFQQPAPQQQFGPMPGMPAGLPSGAPSIEQSGVINFAKLIKDAKAGAAWPEGDYDFEVAEVEATASAKGSPMLKVKLRCLVGTYAGKTITNYFTLTMDSPMALNIFFRQMAAFGLPETFFAQFGENGNLEPVAAELRGKRATITLEQEERQGAKQNKVKIVKPFGGVGASGAPMVGAPMAPPPPPPAPPAPAQALPMPSQGMPPAPEQPLYQQLQQPAPTAQFQPPPPPQAPVGPPEQQFQQVAPPPPAPVYAEPQQQYAPQPAEIPNGQHAVDIAPEGFPQQVWDGMQEPQRQAFRASIAGAVPAGQQPV